MENSKSVDQIIVDLKERAKELNCLYQVQEVLNKPDATLDEICESIIKAMQLGWQFPDICHAKIVYREQEFRSPGYKDTKWRQCADIRVQDEKVGHLCVCYLEERPAADEGPFLKEERKLINTIAEQFGLYILHQQLKDVFKQRQGKTEQRSDWGVILDLLKRTDPKLLVRISRKMVNYLCWTGIKEAEKLLEHFSPAYKDESEILKEMNRPFQRQPDRDLLSIAYTIFEVAGRHLNDREVLSNIQKWIKEDRSGFLVTVLENTGSSLAEISSAIERYHHLAQQGLELSSPRELSFRVALIRRLLSDQAGFIDVAKEFLYVDKFNELIQRIIYPVGSHGKLGGKSSGLFLARQILQKKSSEENLLAAIKTPKTWYLTSDTILEFISYNNLEDIIEQKYKDIGQVRQEYPYVVHVFKNSSFPPEIIKGLSLALDDLRDVPLIIRSTSLLEDRLGAAFAGKYKSLFIANQGTKEQRLVELMDAISEVYASTFGPDPIEYRAEHGLLDYHEEMGIMIQEVVGTRVGPYFFPAFAGVAFSQNDFRWSSRIKREDGLVRLVPGLGTRAVDRLSDDYPILLAPGKPGLRVNVTMDEIIRYSPKHIDLINLESQSFETIEFKELLRQYGPDYPFLTKLVSVAEEDHIKQLRPFGIDFEQNNFVVTFDGLTDQTDFIKQINAVLKTLSKEYDHPVDIEFAHDGEHFYLLQCRSQSYTDDVKPVAIPEDIAPDKIVFSANRHISNGMVSDISHIVYISPQKYSELGKYQQLLEVGKAVGRLNSILPKRQFILIGPGRWGSRGDIKLGVSVTYSEINNTAMLVEVARAHKGYLPDLSFGTHFFQDLVEANIRYLPLYPDEDSTIFNEPFFEESENILPEILADFAHLSDVIRVIDVTRLQENISIKVLMNAEVEKAVAFLTDEKHADEAGQVSAESPARPKADYHWRWRLQYAEILAARLDGQRFAVNGMYLFGSTKNGTAGPGSDINLIIHFGGSEKQKKELQLWLEGWNESLSQMNFLRSGIKVDRLLDVHFISDDDIKKGSSYALKIGAVSDAARPLKLMNVE